MNFIICRNVPLRELTSEEQAEVDKKAYEIENGIKNEDIDEDDAGNPNHRFL